MNAKPTLYNGKTYKSRLEASFARWLTKNDVLFDYETGCLGSEQYTPDFVLYTETGQCPDVDYRETQIEIKPICFSDDAWLAIRAAQEDKKTLFVLDSPERKVFACYAIVLNGELAFFTSSILLAHQFCCNSHPSTIPNGLLGKRKWNLS